MKDKLEECLKSVTSRSNVLVPNSPDKLLKCLSVPVNDVKVVIVGQDPYPQPNVATGYAFAVESGMQPSLEILNRELSKEYSGELDTTLQTWVKQGVVLLNAGLTCEHWKPGVHINLWNDFMVDLIKVFNDLKLSRESMDSIVFVGLGSHANKLLENVNKEWHIVINRFHPAAESHGSHKFEGFFKEVNLKLVEMNLQPIKWYE